MDLFGYWAPTVVSDTLGEYRACREAAALMDFSMLRKMFNEPNAPINVDLWLEEGNLIDLGNFRLTVMYTPGHTSACITLFEPDKGLLFASDTLMPGGVMGGVPFALLGAALAGAAVPRQRGAAGCAQVQGDGARLLAHQTARRQQAALQSTPPAVNFK